MSRIAWALTGLLLVVLACSQPPLKERAHAEGAIEAARAAGAEAYAPEEFQAALGALARYEEAVALHDYRLALNHALDAGERAQEAARQAADRKALIRSQVERTLAVVEPTLEQIGSRLKGVPPSRASSRTVSEAREAFDTVSHAVQEARTALARDDYLAASRALEGVPDQVEAAQEALEPSVPARRRR